MYWQGELEVVKEIPKRPGVESKESGTEESNNKAGNEEVVTDTSRVQFLMLGLDLPPPPLFKDAMEKNIIPQVYILSCLFLCY
jgi:U4/U6.U5 tri-snRNP-associated protein 2